MSDNIAVQPEPTRPANAHANTNASNEQLKYQRQNEQQQQQQQNLEAQPTNQAQNPLKRPRVPHKVAISHIACRFLGLAISIASIVIFVVLYIKYDKKLWLCLAAAAYCIPLDFLDIIPVLNKSRKIPRLRFSILSLLEFPGIGLALGSIVLYLWSVWHITEGAPVQLQRVDMWMQAQWFGDLIIGIWRVVMAITMCRCSLLEDRRKKMAAGISKKGKQIEMKQTTEKQTKGKQTVYA